MYGGRLRYERIKEWSLYFGADISYAEGRLRGESGSESKIYSNLIDTSLEGRLGYTFCFHFQYKFLFTPFLGIGYFWEKNNFRHPSPIPVHFRNTFSYLPIGFETSITFNRWEIGFRVTSRHIWKHAVKVTQDPNFDKMQLHYIEKTQYRLEAPITFFSEYFCQNQIRFTPFWEHRHYGHLANFPFDFLETKFRLFGADLQLLFIF